MLLLLAYVVSIVLGGMLYLGARVLFAYLAPAALRRSESFPFGPHLFVALLAWGAVYLFPPSWAEFGTLSLVGYACCGIVMFCQDKFVRSYYVNLIFGVARTIRSCFQAKRRSVQTDFRYSSRQRPELAVRTQPVSAGLTIFPEGSLALAGAVTAGPTRAESDSVVAGSVSRPAVGSEPAVAEPAIADTEPAAAEPVDNTPQGRLRAALADVEANGTRMELGDAAYLFGSFPERHWLRGEYIRQDLHPKIHARLAQTQPCGNVNQALLRASELRNDESKTGNIADLIIRVVRS